MFLPVPKPNPSHSTGCPAEAPVPLSMVMALAASSADEKATPAVPLPRPLKHSTQVVLPASPQFRNPWRVAELKQTMLSFPRKKWDFSNKTWNVKARVWTSILTVAMWVWDVGLDSRKIYNLRETGVLHPKNGVSCRYSQTNHDWDSSSVVADACIDLAEWVHLMFRWGLLPLSSFFFEQVSFIRIFINQCWFKFQHLHLAFPAEMSFQSLRFSLQKHFEWVTVIFPVENNQKLRCAPFYFRTHFKRKSTVLAWFMCSCSAFHSVPSGKLPIQHFRDGSTCERTTRNHVQVVSSDTFVCYKHRYYIIYTYGPRSIFGRKLQVINFWRVYYRFSGFGNPCFVFVFWRVYYRFPSPGSISKKKCLEYYRLSITVNFGCSSYVLTCYKLEVW